MNEKTAEIVGSVTTAHTDISLLGLIAEADLLVQLVMLLLILASFWCWAIIYNKWQTLRSLRHRSDVFEKLFRSSKNDPKELYDRITRGNKNDNPMARVFISSIQEMLQLGKNNQPQSDSDIKEAVSFSIHEARSKCMEELEKGLSFLATVGSSAPFIGLFGTVWGIMSSFQSIAASKNTTLAVVAPGIAEALLATAVGLFAAIPAAIFYNLYSHEIRKYSQRLSNFSHELTLVLKRHA